MIKNLIICFVNPIPGLWMSDELPREGGSAQLPEHPGVVDGGRQELRQRDYNKLPQRNHTRLVNSLNRQYDKSPKDQ